MNPFYGKHHTEETKEVLSNLAKERYLDEDNPFYGKYHTNESKKKMSEAHKKIPKENMVGMGRKTQNLQYEQCKRLIIKKLFNMIYNIKRSQDINQ